MSTLCAFLRTDDNRGFTSSFRSQRCDRPGNRCCCAIDRQWARGNAAVRRCRPGARRRGRDRRRLVAVQARKREAAGRAGRCRYRHRQRRRQDRQEPAQDLRHAARPDARQDRRHHRARRRQRHGQVRQAGRRGRRDYAFHQPVGNPGEQGDDGAEGRQRHRHRAVAVGLEQHQRRRAVDARGARARRRARRPGADTAASGIAQHDAAVDGAGRPDRRHRLAEQRALGLPQRHAGDRRRRRQRAGDHRQQRRPRRRGGQDRRLEDFRQLDFLFLGKLAGHPR